MNNSDLDDWSQEISDNVLESCGRFCSCCGKEVEQAEDDSYTCPTCGSDDLMLWDDGFTTWNVEDVIENMVAESMVKPIDEDEVYREMLDECYGMISVCDYEYYPSTALESLDPIAYRCGLADYISGQAGDDIWCKIDGTYYPKDEVLALFGIAI
jgi:hypothetical protein